MDWTPKFWQAKLTDNGRTIYAFHVYIRGLPEEYKRIWGESDVHAWEKVTAKMPNAHVRKIVPAPPIEQTC